MVKDWKNRSPLLLCNRPLSTHWRLGGDREAALTSTRERASCKRGVYMLAGEHALWCVAVVAQFVYMVTRLFIRLLFVLRRREMIQQSKPFFFFFLMSSPSPAVGATPVIIIMAQCSGMLQSLPAETHLEFTDRVVMQRENAWVDGICFISTCAGSAGCS